MRAAGMPRRQSHHGGMGLSATAVCCLAGVAVAVLAVGCAAQESREPRAGCHLAGKTVSAGSSVGSAGWTI